MRYDGGASRLPFFQRPGEGMSTMQDSEVVVVSGARTAIGTFGGAFRDVPARELAAAAIREAIERAGLAPGDVDEVILGCVAQIGEDAYIARTSALAAGLPHESTAY